MIWTTIVGLLAILQYIFFAVLVGKARVKTGINAPAMTGHPDLERAQRVHYNTLEMMVAFLPAMWAFGTHVSDVVGAGIGAVYLVGRALYARSYVRDPAKRGPGFGLSLLPVLVLTLGALGTIVWRMVT